MIRLVDIQGSCRKSFSLTKRPPRVFFAQKRGEGERVPIFEPYNENLPLETGTYSFVLDEDGRFRVKRGYSTSHSAMVGGAPVGMAGRFRINRAGNVAVVTCRSPNYRISVRDPSDPTVRYVLDAFAGHHALEVSPWAIFEFPHDATQSFQVGIDGRLINDPETYRLQLDIEGQGTEAPSEFSADQIERFAHFSPEPPARLYGMHLDQLIIAVEGEDASPFEYSDPMPRYAPRVSRLNSGKKAFVLDRDGWLIVGPYGHHILSGGGDVGGAGQIVVDTNGLVTEINLNFSGHYRPPLDACYARYVYQILRNHPLIHRSSTCTISGRKFDEEGELSTVLRFDEDELVSDQIDLDLLIEMAFV